MARRDERRNKSAAPAETEKQITVSKETIWHMVCGHCHYYWTVPTMSEEDDPTRRAWHCPLCGIKSSCRHEGSPQG